ncbi:MAG: DUF2911 domain-containing protein, partial [Gemmatimonas sp.]
SELASVSQTIDGTKLTVEYSRPRARGRTPLFGTRIVQWDEVWTPGANYATTFQSTRDVKINGANVPKGMYSVWAVVKQEGDWTLVLDPRPRLFHMAHPDSTAQQIRLPVKVTQQPSMDVLTWWFPEVRDDGAVLAMGWGTFRATMNVTVEASLVSTTARDVAAAYVGRYEGTDSSDKSKPPQRYSINITHEQGVLRGVFDPTDEYLRKFALLLVGPDLFTVGVYDDGGRIYEVLRPDMMITFKREGGRVVGIEVRDDADNLVSTGRRVR